MLQEYEKEMYCTACDVNIHFLLHGVILSSISCVSASYINDTFPVMVPAMVDHFVPVKSNLER